jgi:hypothetical protein
MISIGLSVHRVLQTRLLQFSEYVAEVKYCTILATIWNLNFLETNEGSDRFVSQSCVTKRVIPHGSTPGFLPFNK